VTRPRLDSCKAVCKRRSGDRTAGEDMKRGLAGPTPILPRRTRFQDTSGDGVRRTFGPLVVGSSPTGPTDDLLPADSSAGAPDRVDQLLQSAYHDPRHHPRTSWMGTGSRSEPTPGTSVSPISLPPHTWTPFDRWAALSQPLLVTIGGRPWVPTGHVSHEERPAFISKRCPDRRHPIRSG
jgi:hypothetical protein